MERTVFAVDRACAAPQPRALLPEFAIHDTPQQVSTYANRGHDGAVQHLVHVQTRDSVRGVGCADHLNVGGGGWRLMDADFERRKVAAWVRAASYGPEPVLLPAAEAAIVDLDLARVRAVVSAHRVAPWIVAALDSAGRSDVARESGLRDTATLHALRGLQLDYEVRAVLADFDQHAIQSIVLKGPAVAHRYYPRPELRPYNDIDVLVRDRDEARAQELLRLRGYVQGSGETRDPLHHEHAKFQSTFVRSDGCTVDLHRDHLQIGLRPLTLDDVWERAVPGMWGAHARVLEDHDQFVLLAVHLQRHGFERLLWFKDLDLMVRRANLDWARIAEISQLEGCTSAVAYALSLLEDMLATPLPPGARAIAHDRGLFARVMQALLWPRRDVLSLEPQRAYRWRRAVQFAPESGVIRGGLPALFTWGRRGAKARVLLAAMAGRHRH